MTSADYVIRPARLGDVEQLTVLLGDLFTMESDFAPDPVAQRKGLAALLREGDVKLLVAEANDRVIGMCSAQLLVSTAQGGVVALVEDVIVVKDRRGQGIGRTLLKALERWALDEGASRLQLVADKDNAEAMAFYGRLGWKKTNLVVFRKML